MRVAITGATGLLGANVAVACVEAGHSVVCTHRESSNRALLDGVEVNWRQASVQDVDALSEAFTGCDWVFHCAAMTSVLPKVTPALRATNVLGTDHVIEAVQRAGVSRLIHTSSTVAVGVSRTGEPSTEESPWNLPAVGLNDGYAITKRDSEQHVIEAAVAGQIDAVVVNPGFMFGPYDAKPSSGQMIMEVAAGRAKVYTPGKNCFVDARSVAKGMLLAAEKGRLGERYILGGSNLSYQEVFGLIAEIVGQAPPKFCIPRALAQPIGIGGDLVQWWTGREQAITQMVLAWGYEPGFIFSSNKAMTELGYEPGSVREGIEAAWAWFQDPSNLCSRPARTE